MCIRDSGCTALTGVEAISNGIMAFKTPRSRNAAQTMIMICLLYTSDAADERSSVDLGGRRIIKKKTQHKTDMRTTEQNYNETQNKNNK